MELTIVGKENCPNCVKAKTLCDLKEISYKYIEINKDISIEDLFEMCGEKVKSVPQIFNGDKRIGGYQDLVTELS